ncbi:MAG: glycogen synthase, partial [bacterium]
MKVCFAISECVPFVKTGGLADVGGALPKALAQLGCEVKVFLPLYGSISTLEHDLILVAGLENLPIQMGNHLITFNVWHGKLPASDVEVYFIDCPVYYGRTQIYTNDPDEDERFIFFQRAIIEILQRLNWVPDIIHCNDWQTSLLPVYLRLNYQGNELFANSSCLLSIHNIGYQGRFAKESVLKAGLTCDHYYPGGPFEFNDTFCFLKSGISFSEIITTVSESYAHEIQTNEYGAGLEGVLFKRRDDVYGILNGIDTTIWNPEIDAYLPYHYTVKNVRNKKKNKRALLDYANLPFDDNIAVIGMISRLTSQKGFELLQPIIKKLMKLPLQFVVLGSGEKKYEKFLTRTAKSFPDKFFAYIGYNDKLAHQITGGCDLFLMPSRYEPCGLNQMYSLNYGTVPIVRRTGGLADTVQDYHEYYKIGNGFTFRDYSPTMLYLTLQRA